MTPEQIAAWARQAASSAASSGREYADCISPTFLARFAALVAAHERERCRSACIAVNESAAEAASAAKPHESTYVDGYQDAAIDCDEAIRNLA